MSGTNRTARSAAPPRQPPGPRRVLPRGARRRARRAGASRASGYPVSAHGGNRALQIRFPSLRSKEDRDMRLLLTCSLAVLLTVPSASAASSPWTVVHSANNGSDANYLSGIDALAPGDVWAVGSFRDQETSQFVTLAEHWDGTSWSLTATPNRNWGYNELNGVAASSADDVWAVGYDNAGNYGTERTLVEHWDGAAWSVVASPNIGTNASILYDAASVAADDVWAVGVGNSASAGSGKPLIARWNGTRWKLVRNPATGQGGSWLAGLAVLSATNVWAVGGAGDSTLVEHWNGTSWKIVPSPDGPSGPSALRSVAAASKNDVWAVGSSGDETLIEHWN